MPGRTMHLIAIKIGNTNTGIALFQDAQIVRTWRVETRVDKTADEYATELHEFLNGLPGGDRGNAQVAIVSVVPALTGTFTELARRYLHRDPFVVNPGIITGIKIHYQDQRAFGADRLVAIIAAHAKYGGPALVIDFGTATTFNATDANGNFIGGAIAPGLNIAAEALHEFTAKLPRVEISAPPQALATNTRDALRSGIFFGYAGLVEGLIARLRTEMQAPQVRVIATGGMAPRIAPHCPAIEIVDPQLAYDGLRILYLRNRTKDEGRKTDDEGQTTKDEGRRTDANLR